MLGKALLAAWFWEYVLSQRYSNARPDAPTPRRVSWVVVVVVVVVITQQVWDILGATILSSGKIVKGLSLQWYWVSIRLVSE